MIQFYFFRKMFCSFLSPTTQPAEKDECPVLEQWAWLCCRDAALALPEPCGTGLGFSMLYTQHRSKGHFPE